jgi:hypothetical protein
LGGPLALALDDHSAQHRRPVKVENPRLNDLDRLPGTTLANLPHTRRGLPWAEDQSLGGAFEERAAVRPGQVPPVQIPDPPGHLRVDAVRRRRASAGLPAGTGSPMIRALGGSAAAASAGAGTHPHGAGGWPAGRRPAGQCSGSRSSGDGRRLGRGRARWPGARPAAEAQSVGSCRILGSTGRPPRVGALVSPYRKRNTYGIRAVARPAQTAISSIGRARRLRCSTHRASPGRRALPIGGRKGGVGVPPTRTAGP